MATLNEVMKETAEAIREKTGKSELIAPVDFAEEIKGITAGGGESGGSSYIYYDQERTIMNIRNLWEESSTIKIHLNGQTVIMRTLENRDGIKENGLEGSIVAVCIDPNLKFQSGPTEPPLSLIERDPQALEWANEIRITEEEYFNLNA
jgi:hypothetical protein